MGKIAKELINKIYKLFKSVIKTMKRLILMMGTLLCAIVTMLTSSCDKITPTYVSDTEDTLFVREQIEESLNPSFNYSDEVMEYYYCLNDKKNVEEQFMKMCPNTIDDVSRVLLKRHNSITIFDIVYEYQDNKRIYDGLLPDEILPDTTKISDMLCPDKPLKPDTAKVEKPTTTTLTKDSIKS